MNIDVPAPHVQFVHALAKPIVYPPERKIQDNITYRMFINICYHLPPSDLLMLSCVCKHFTNMLNEQLFPTSSEIWKSSRERFTFFKNIKCPPGMTEFHLTKLLNFANGCQMCKNKNITVTIFWIARVRACDKCILTKAKSRNFLLKGNYNITNETLSIIPPLVPCPDDKIDLNFYWVPHVISAKYKSTTFVNKNEYDKWISDMKDESFRQQQEALRYHNLILNEWNDRIIYQEMMLRSIIRDVCGENGVETLRQIPLLVNLRRSLRSNPFVIPNWESYQQQLKDYLAVPGNNPLSITNNTS
ncbi:hypothetical protein Glove_208g23 [Diversispora epigaea]|uniref:F-box domain-containing protein n=1 Tax=Diversispora epigaea TaxID=1348612 RepID=A0A397IIY6_9GLOM|nr:hypothetical protein Glove_208g23 [Diversispora epigaea]